MVSCQSQFTVPIILVCNKLDLRVDPEVIERLAEVKQIPVRWEDGYSVAENIGAYAYLECSARTGQGVTRVFEAAARAALLPKNIQDKLITKDLQTKFKSLATYTRVPKQRDQQRLSKLICIATN